MRISKISDIVYTSDILKRGRSFPYIKGNKKREAAAEEHGDAFDAILYGHIRLLKERDQIAQEAGEENKT